MKFESKFGLGEVCIVKIERGNRSYYELVRIVGVTFSVDGTTSYQGRLPSGLAQWFHECELDGDPEYPYQELENE